MNNVKETNFFSKKWNFSTFYYFCKFRENKTNYSKLFCQNPDYFLNNIFVISF